MVDINFTGYNCLRGSCPRGNCPETTGVLHRVCPLAIGYAELYGISCLSMASAFCYPFVGLTVVSKYSGKVKSKFILVMEKSISRLGH